MRDDIVIASQRVGAKRRPMINSAKQSKQIKMDCFVAALLAMTALLVASPARADLKICNRMSYVVEAAIGIDDKNATATRGWFRIDPATCRVVAQGNIAADRILLHARSLPVYGASPAPQNGTDNLCIATKDFVIAGRQCRAGQTAVPFTEIKPSTGEDGNQGGVSRRRCGI